MTAMHETIKTAFKRSGLSILALSKRSGVPYASTHGAVVGNADPKLTTVDRLSRVLGLELRPAARTQKRKVK